MELKHLRYFVAAVEEGSLQGAAQRLNVAQPALSRRVRDLEALLGCQLLVRSSRGIETTRAGQALYRDAIALFDKLSEATQKVRRIGLEQDRGVRFGLAQGTPRRFEFLGKALGRFMDAFPEPGAALSRNSSHKLAADLAEGELDIALLFEMHPTNAAIEERLIHKERYVLAAHPLHPLASSGLSDVSEIAGHPLVWLARSDLQDGQNPLLPQLRRHGIEPVVSQLADTPEEQIDLAMASGGICLTPASSIKTIAPGQLVFRGLPGFGMELDLTLAWKRDPESPAANALLVELHSAIDDHQKAIVSGAGGQLDGQNLFRVPD
ncbi:MAG: LysR family transcriptional regulator [Novosphingobium sp.]|nr:LysR family transcriptional regulator [Novosphingobium sp.]